MSYYLIGIGGTGARCMEAFIHLCGAGLLKDSQPVKMVYVDADVSCGNLTRTQQTADLYEKARKIGYGNTGMFKNPIDQTELWNPVDDKCKNMDDVFSRTTLKNKLDTKNLGYLYDSLFTYQERTTDLRKGFRGHPAIGSAIMNQKMKAEDSPWKELLPQINSDKDARIFLFASVFGGTGAAGFPTIAKLLHEFLNKDSDGNCIAKIGGALVLPYFQFPPSDEKSEKEMQAKVEEFMLNTKAALDYYRNDESLLGPVFNSIYMVGDNDLTEVKKFSLGSTDQKNEANIIEVYAALAAFDFFNKVEFGPASTPMIARSDEVKDGITWNDLPNVSTNTNLKVSLGTYIKFLYVYKHGILKTLEKCAINQNEKKHAAWYLDLVEKSGKINVTKDQLAMDEFKSLGEYTNVFFSWMKDIITNSKRKVALVNNRVCEDTLMDSWFKLDVYQIILPIIEHKDKLDGDRFWNKLCDYKKTHQITNTSGSEILMQAIYEICNE